MTAPSWHGESFVDDLLADPIEVGTVRARVPRSSGIYAWWARRAVLATVAGPAHPALPDIELLYVGIATDLRSRLASNHLGRTGSSTLRRTLAGLLLDEQRYRTRWTTDRVVLVDVDELRLTEWMQAHLQVSWCEHRSPRVIEAQVIRVLRPPLNVDHAEGAVVDLIRAARRRYRASAGPRPAGSGP
ncbi:MAG: GIY-YIG nuclease family protein [Pseudonocardia sp.]